MMVSAPATAAMHDRFPEAIEEEVEVLNLDFAAYDLEWQRDAGRAGVTTTSTSTRTTTTGT